MKRPPFTPARLHLVHYGIVLITASSGCASADEPFDASDDDVMFDVSVPAGDEPERGAADEQESADEDPFGLAAEVDPVAVAGETASPYLGVRRVTDYYLNPLYAEASYASPSIPGCSSTMVGPNILVTAAHCGADNLLTMNAQGRVYRERDITLAQTASYQCRLLFHTFPETDLAVYHCPPVGTAPSLGDRFGWVDLALFEPTTNQSIFSVFTNPIVDEGISSASLLTRGYVSNTNVTSAWANPNTPPGVNSPTQVPEVMKAELWSSPGASGSGHFNNAGDMSLGPLSTGVTDGVGRWALSMRDYLYYGWIYTPQSASCPDPSNSTSCNTDNTVNASYVSSLGLNPSGYVGRLADDDRDWSFDLVADVEDLEGENYKVLYHQSFGSLRQSKQWQMGPGSTLDVAGGYVSYLTTNGGLQNSWRDIARHDNLNLTPNQHYEVSFGLGSNTGYYRVCMRGTTTVCSPYFFDGSGNDEVTHRVSMVAPAGDPELVIQTWNGGGGLFDVSLTTSLTYSYVYLPSGWTALLHYLNDFDTFDARESWVDPDDYGRPVILPDGDDAGVDWAARISTVNSGVAGFDYDLQTETLPFPAEGGGTLCFRSRMDESESWEGATLGRVRVERLDGTAVDGTYFIPTEDWNQTCVEVEAGVENGEALRVKFGLYTTGPGTRRGAYFVDDVEVRLPSD